MNRKTIGVVLAGGMSTRMGCDKKEIVLADGKSFLCHAINRLAVRCEQVIVSGVASDDAIALDQSTLQRCKLVFLPDAFPFRGPLCGLLTVFHWFDSQKSINASDQSIQFLVTPVDMPNLTSDDIERMLTAAATQDSLTPKPTVATFDSFHLDPMVGVYPAELAGELRQLAQTEHKSLSRWLKGREIQQCTLPIHAGRNMNTPADLDNLDNQLLPVSKPASS